MSGRVLEQGVKRLRTVPISESVNDSIAARRLTAGGAPSCL